MCYIYLVKKSFSNLLFPCFFPFQAVLETIRNLMNTDCVVPDWLHDIILGYGDPSSAHYSKMPNQIASLDFNDTFLSIDHLKASFPGYNIKVTVDNPELQVPPFRWSQDFKCSWSVILAAVPCQMELSSLVEGRCSFF